MMLLLLDTGIRLTELSTLLISDLDFQDGFIRIAQGTGNKSRFVPMQKTCAAALRSYLRLRDGQQHDALWISSKGQPSQSDTIEHSIIKHCHDAGVRGSAQTDRFFSAKPSNEEWIDLFLQDCRSRNLSQRSIAYYESTLHYLLQVLEEQQQCADIDRITADNLQRHFLGYMLEKQLAPQTINGRF